MKSAGQPNVETQARGAGEPGGHVELETRHPAAARRKSKLVKSSAGQVCAETQTQRAGEPGGQSLIETLDGSAARRKHKTAGQRLGETQEATARNGVDSGHTIDETQISSAAVRATIDMLIEVGRRNDFAIRQRMRIRQATLSHIARSEFGYHTRLPDAERKKAMDAATKLVKAIRDGQEHALSMLVRATDLAAAPWEEIQTGTEKADGQAR